MATTESKEPEASVSDDYDVETDCNVCRAQRPADETYTCAECGSAVCGDCAVWVDVSAYCPGCEPDGEEDHEAT